MELPPGSETEDTTVPSRVETRNTLLQKYDIPIGNLDFSYVEKCTDGKQLERILQILQSGEEGFYPQLMTATEERLRVIKPNSRFIRPVTSVLDKKYLDVQTKEELDTEINHFLQNATQNDSELGKYKQIGSGDIPEVRKTSVISEEIEQPEEKPRRIKATDYASWDKYDPDTEILKMDLETEQLQKQHTEKDVEQTQTPPKKEVKFDDFYTETEAGIESNQERLKGNEYYKSGDYKEALACYTNSINIHPSIEGYNNRAQVNIVLKNFQQAMTDSQAALKYDQNNIKANMRLAQCLNELHFYQDAIKHLERIIYLDPNNTNAQNLLNTVKSKHNKQLNASANPSGDGAWSKGGKTRMKIMEISSTESSVAPRSNSSSSTPNQRKVKRKSILKKSAPSPCRPHKSHVLVPIPGPSHMQEPYYVVLDNKDPEMIKRAQYILYNKPQMMFVCHPDDSDDEYLENYDHSNIDYENNKSDSRSTTTLKDINQKIKNFAKNKSVKENNRNKMHTLMPKIEVERKSSVEITEIPDDMQTDSAIDITENICEISAEFENLSIVEPNKSVDAVIEEMHCDNANDVNNNNQNQDVLANGASSAGGGGEPHLELNNNVEINRIEVETPFSFLRTWTAVQRDDTYAEHAKVLRNVNENRLVEVIGFKLDGTMLTDILRTLDLHFTVPHEVERVHAFLTNMATLPRFNVVALFLSAFDKVRTRSLFEFLEQHGLPLPDDIKGKYL